MKSARTYTLGKRAESAARTRDRILDAAVELFWERPTRQLSLDEVAARAGVSVQTVIRHFGGREGLFAAAGEREGARVVDQRAMATSGDLKRAVTVLFDHYEDLGAGVLRMIAASEGEPGLRPAVERGRDVHRQWCETVFAEPLSRRRGPARARLRAQLIALCDVQTWNLLRHEAGLGRRSAERALLDMITPLLEAAR